MILLDDCFQVENKRFLNKENGTDVSLNVCEDEAGEGVVRDGQNFEVVEGLGGEVQLDGIVRELQGVLLAAFLVFPLKPERDRVGALILDTLPERVIEFEKKRSEMPPHDISLIDKHQRNIYLQVPVPICLQPVPTLFITEFIGKLFFAFMNNDLQRYRRDKAIILGQSQHSLSVLHSWLWSRVTMSPCPARCAF